MQRATILGLLFLVACGAEVESTNGPATPAESASNAPGASPAPAPTAPSQSAPVGSRVVLENTSSAPRWVVFDAQGTPVDFQIGQPPMQLNGYGSYWCGGPQSNHNDPFAYATKIEPGAVASRSWWAISVTREGDCWKGTPLAPGAYPTKACFYESEPDGIGAPGTKAKSVPLTCTDVTLTITGANETVLSF